MRHGWHVGCALLFFSTAAAAQSQPWDVDIPLNIVTPEAALVRHMPASRFTAHHGGDSIPIRSVDTDTAPRRIVVVVENGRSVNAAARKVEASVLAAIIANARPEDSSAFLTTGGSHGRGGSFVSHRHNQSENRRPALRPLPL